MNQEAQEAHDILNAVRIIDLQILRLLSKKKMLESCLYPSGIRYDLDKVQGSPENQLEKLTGEIFEVERKIRDLYSAKLDKAAEIEQLINLVESEEYRTILMLRYIGHMSINKIAESMSYSPDWVYKKHRKAVDEVGKIMKGREDHERSGRMTIDEIKQALHKADLELRPNIIFVNPLDAKTIKDAFPEIDEKIVLIESELIEKGKAYEIDRRKWDEWAKSLIYTWPRLE